MYLIFHKVRRKQEENFTTFIRPVFDFCSILYKYLHFSNRIYFRDCFQIFPKSENVYDSPLIHIL